MISVRLLFSNFCGIQAFKQDLVDESPCFFLKRMVQVTKAQFVLTAVWGVAAIASFFTAGLTAAALGAAVVSLVMAVASIMVQFKTFWMDRQKSGGYRTLVTHE